MSDPIEKLSSLGDALEGTPMPMSAAAARARGDRLRRRNHAILATGAAIVVAAVTLPVLAFAIGGSDDADDRIAPQPTITDPAPAARLSEENLLTEADAGAPYGGAGDWVVRDTFRGDGQSAFHPCATTSLAGLGAETVLRREFSLDPAVEGGSGFLTAIAGEFADAESARAAYDDLAMTLTECDQARRGWDFYDVESTERVAVDVDGEARRAYASYTTADTVGFRNGMETGLVLAGDRLEVVVSVLGVQDYDTADPPMEAILPKAARRLVLGTGAPDGGAPTGPVIPDSFPLAAGWPEDAATEGGDHGLVGPDRALDPLEFTACGETVTATGHVDLLRADWTNVEDFRSRQLTVHGDADAAAAFVGDVVELYSACPTGPTREDGFTPTYEVGQLDAGDEAWAVLDRDTFEGAASVYGETIVVVRVGRAVLAITWGGHAGYPQGDGTAKAGDMLSQAAEAIAAMAGLQEDGASEPDLSQPAGTTEVPEGFPLDARPAGPPTGATVTGPDPSENGVFPTTICDEELATVAQPFEGGQLGYRETYEGEGNHGRTVRAYPSVQAAVDEVARLRDQVAGCRRDVPWESTSERVWRDFGTSTGWDAFSFGYTVEGQASGVLYTVARVGNAVLAIQTSGELGEDALRAEIPAHEAVVEAIAPEMCVFTVDGC